MRTKASASFATSLPLAEVIGSLTDFSPRRAEIWPALDATRFAVHEVGDTWAVVTEGTSSPNVWARERYDWSTPDEVSWRAEESNFCAPGSGVDVRAVADPAGGSRVEITWQRTSTSPTGLMIVILFRLFGRRMLVDAYRPVWERLAQESSAR
jgi:hypothetical protein